MSEPQKEYETEQETDAQPTTGPAYADGTYVVACPPDGRPNGEVIMRPSGFGNDLPADEQRANATLTAAAFDAAQEAKEMGYDPVAALKALPELLKACKDTVEAQPLYPSTAQDALESAEGSEDE